MENPSNLDLYMLLGELKKGQSDLENKFDDYKRELVNAHEKHIIDDEKKFTATAAQFAVVNKNISSMNKYGSGIAVVASVISVAAKCIWDKYIGKT